jgi:hypothetical protein
MIFECLNIVNAVGTKQKVMDALMELAHIHFEQDVPPDVEAASESRPY